MCHTKLSTLHNGNTVTEKKITEEAMFVEKTDLGDKIHFNKLCSSAHFVPQPHGS